MTKLVYLVGAPGSGKTTLTKQLVARRPPMAAKRGTKKAGYWLEDDALLVFGRWAQHDAVFRPSKASRLAGRLDGGDRNQPGRANADCLEALEGFVARGGRTILSESVNTSVLNRVFVARAVALGCDVVVLELDTPEATSKARMATRDGVDAPAVDAVHARWQRRRRAWSDRIRVATRAEVETEIVGDVRDYSS